MAAALIGLTDCCQPCDQCTGVDDEDDDGDGDGGGSAVVGWFTAISLAEARAIPTATTNEFLTINGFEPGGDPSLSGIFTWSNTSTAVHDGASVIMPNDSPAAGRWHRQI